MKAALRPKRAVNTPPRAAPTASMAPHVEPIMAVAVGRSSGSTRLGMAAWEAGEKKAARPETDPRAAKATHTRPGPTARKHRAAAVCRSDTRTMTRRRSKWSAAGPATVASRKLGNVWATKMAAAATSEWVRSRTRPSRATVVNQSPM